ncbi:MAG: hypothetical protein HC797_02285, partial [Anaerolineales bacterium]|nr:hypothetical protein [Anaerolineales bacterium]
MNLIETELPPLVEEDENSTPRFWTRWLTRKPQAESTPEPILSETPTQVEE